MSIKLNKAGYDHAAALIKHGFEVEHDVHNWDEVKPDRDDKSKYINTHDLDEYGLWFLGIDTNADQKSIDKYCYPYGDFNVVQKSGILAAEKEAAKHNHAEIHKAAQELLAHMKKK